MQLSRVTYGFYAAPAVVISLLTMTLIIYIPPFYATEVGLGLSKIGVLFLLARSWDAFIDPAIGHLSDNTRSRWGARKPWIFGGTPLLIGATWWLFNPPDDASAIYMLILVFLYYFAWTMVQIPYLSWGAELSADYRERNTIVGVREGAMFVGVILATGLPMLLFPSGNPPIGDILNAFAWMTVLLLPVGVFLALRWVPSAAARTGQATSLKATFKVLRSNRPFMILIVATFLGWSGLHIYNATVLLIIEFGLQLPSSAFLRLVFIQFAVGALVTPLIAKVASSWGKHRVLALGTFGTALSLPLLTLVSPGQMYQVYLVFCLLGVVISPIWILPTALVADAVDYGRLHGGGDQAGLYISLYNLSTKMALALSVGVALPLVELLGFDPLAGDPTQGSDKLMLVGLLMPGIVLIPASVLLWRYPIDEQAHIDIQSSLAKISADSEAN